MQYAFFGPLSEEPGKDCAIRCEKAVDHPTFTATVRPPTFGLWLSLVERFVRDEEAAGSNPASPTTLTLWKSEVWDEMRKPGVLDGNHEW